MRKGCDEVGQPIVSVIMPAYNGEKYIGEAIESIQTQTWQNWEMIIIEDCSTDQTLSVIRNYLQDNRIKLWQNDYNMGIAESRNKAIEKAAGKYIAIQDDDDISLPNRLEDQVLFLEENPDIAAVAGHWMMVDETGRQVLRVIDGYRNPKYVKAHLLFSDCIGNGSTMMNREFINKHHLRYQNDMLGMEDFCFWIEFSKCGLISSVNSIVYKNRRHQDEATEMINKTQENKRKELFMKLQKKSLQLSGFSLSSDTLDTLKRLAGEYTDPMLKGKDYQELYEALREIINNAYARNLDFADEIAIACRKLLGKKISNSKGLWNIV